PGEGLGARRLLEPLQEDRHLLAGLLVTLAMGGRDAVAIRGDRAGHIAALGERLAQELPRRRVVRILLDGPTQMSRRSRRISRAEVMRSKAEAQQRAVLSRGEKRLEALGGIHGIHGIMARHARPSRQRGRIPPGGSMLRMLRFAAAAFVAFAVP